MQCSRLAAAGCLATLIGSTALSAQALPPTPQRTAADEPARLLPPSAPIDPAFEQRLADQLRSISPRFAQTEPDGGTLRHKAPTPSLAPRQICGIRVLLPADSSIDPKFEVPPRDTKTQFGIRTVPVLCR